MERIPIANWANVASSLLKQFKNPVRALQRPRFGTQNLEKMITGSPNRPSEARLPLVNVHGARRRARSAS